MQDNIQIGVNEIVNQINVTPSIIDQTVDIGVTDNSYDVVLNIENRLVQVNIIKGLNAADVVTSINGENGDVIIDKNTLGLGQVDNTSDLDKPISTATQTALNNKQPLDGDLTSIAELAGTSGFLKKNGVNSWNLDNSTYLSSISSNDVTTALGFTPENAANKGVNNGYASLDGTGKVPSTQLPSYVDDVIEVSNVAALPVTGETGKIYITLDTNKIYRWSGTVYVEISASVGTVWGAITGTISNQTDLRDALNSKAPINSPTFTGTVSGITKGMVELGNVDNTSDLNKPISTATQTALDLKANLASPTFTGTVSGITKSMVGLSNVDNTSDVNKPISSATQTALNSKYDASNPSGYISGITSNQVTTALGYTPENVANKGANNGYASLGGDGKVPSSQLPSYVDDVIEASSFSALPTTGETGKIYVTIDTNKIYRWNGSIYVELSTSTTAWGSITGTLSNQTDLQNALNAKENSITAGTTAQYYRGDKSFQTLNTSVVPEGSNLYFTDARVNANANVTANTAARHNAVTLGTANGLSLSAQVLSLGLASGSANGALSSTDWTTFNDKYPASNPNGYTSNVGTVTSVGMTVPSAFSVSGSPITSSGTLAITATGNTTQYIAGDGSLVTFPTVGIAGTLIREVRNTTGATLTKGTVVYISGATGNKPTVSKAIATGDSTSAQTFGLVQADIAANANGNVVCVGDITGLDTSAFTEGTQLYLSSTTAGAYTATKQLAPNHLVYIGVVTRSHNNLGQIEVNIQNGYELYELHDVSITSEVNNQGLFYEASTDLWKNKSIATVLGYTAANDSEVVKLTGTQSIAGQKTFTGNLLIEQGINLKQDGQLSFNSGYNLIDADATSVIFGLPNGTSVAHFVLSNLTQQRYYDLPNYGGTIALISDIPSLAGYVTTTGNQSIAGFKTFTGYAQFENGVYIKQDGTLQGITGYNTLDANATSVIFSLPNTSSAAEFKLSNLTQLRFFDLPNASGTIALTSDIPSLTGYVATTGNQTIAGDKTFTGAVINDGSLYLKQDSVYAHKVGYTEIFSSLGQIVNFNFGTSGVISTFTFANTTNTSNYNFPNASGTVALTSDLAGYVATTGNQSISGTKTFTTQLHANVLKFSESGGFNQTAGFTQIGGTADYFSFANGTNAKSAQFTYGTGTAFNLPSSNGTIALTSDLHNAVTIGTANGLSLSTQTLSLGLASSSTNGALSSTDWNTFNGKQNALTNPVTGTGTSSYLPKFTGTTTLGNSSLYDTGSVLLVGATSASDSQSKLELVSAGPTGLKIISSAANGNNTFLSIQSSKEWRFLTNRGDISGNQGDLIIRNNTDGINHIILNQGGSTTFAASVSATSFNLGNGQFLRLTRNTGALQYDAFGIVSGTDNTRLISTGDFDVVNGALASQFKINSAGNVGINATTISQNFAGYTHLDIGNATNGGILLFSNGTGTNYGYINGASSGVNIRSVTGNTTFANHTGGNSVTILGSNGRVGIGMGDPTRLFSVLGGEGNGILVNGFNGVVSLPSNGLSLNTGYNVGYITNYTTAGALADLYYSASKHIFVEGPVLVNTSGSAASVFKLQVGDGTTDSRAFFNPNNPYSIGLANGTSSAWYIGVNAQTAANGLQFYSNEIGGAAMTITTTTRVGIGTSTPGVRFVNSGAPLASIPTLGSGTIGANAILSSNGLYGLYTGVSSEGWVWQQVQRNDAGTAVYSLVLQPSGGNVLIGTTSDYGSRLNIAGGTTGIYLVRTGGYASIIGHTDLVLEGGASGSKDIYLNPYSLGNVYVGSLGTGTVYSNAGRLTNTNPSDSRLKKNIKSISYGLADIMKLRPVSYNWETDKINQGIQFGFIAQEVQEIMPDAIKEFGEETKFLGLEKDAIYATFVNAIKELKAELDTLKNK